MANIITGIRIVCSIALLFCIPSSPVFSIPLWLLLWTAVIALIKVISIICGYAKQKEFVAAHTVMNKLTGIALFILPLTVTFIDLRYSGAFVCILATFAAIEEGHLIRTKEMMEQSII